MFTNITIGRYIYKNSLIHKINPLFKIISIIIILVSSLLFNLIQNILLLILTILLIYLTKVDMKTYLKNIYGFRFFIIGILLIYIISRVSVFVIINNIIKIIINILISSTLLYTTTLKELNHGLYKLFYPLKYIKIDPAKISIVLTLSIKFITLVFEETDTIFKAFKNRGLKFDGSIRLKIKKIKMFISTLFYLLLKKSENISNNLTIRNCDLEKLVNKKKLRINHLDALFLTNIILVIIIIFKIV